MLRQLFPLTQCECFFVFSKQNNTKHDAECFTKRWNYWLFNEISSSLESTFYRPLNEYIANFVGSMQFNLPCETIFWSYMKEGDI